MHISNIRKKFKNLDEPDPVETIWGIEPVLGAYVSDKRVYLEFTNDVKNPDSIDIEKGFDRFYKADESRGRASSGFALLGCEVFSGWGTLADFFD